MALTPTLKSIRDLFGKLERESYRTYHATKRIHKADHFYNFCVTAHSMKDYFFEHNGLTTNAARAPFHREWNGDECLVAATEIANTSKHFTLRQPRTAQPRKTKTEKVRQGKGVFVDIYLENSGDLREEFVDKPDLFVTLEGGNEVPLYEFIARVEGYWYKFLRAKGVNVRRQPVSKLLP